MSSLDPNSINVAVIEWNCSIHENRQKMKHGLYAQGQGLHQIR